MTINCLKAHADWIEEYPGGIWICLLCVARRQAALVARAVLTMAKAKAAEQERAA